MRDYPQAEHCDLGIVPDDNTPDMRKPPAATEGFAELPTFNTTRK